jgi:hypothetical protein
MPGLVAALVIPPLMVTAELAAEVVVRAKAGADILLHHIQEVADMVKTRLEDRGEEGIVPVVVVICKAHLRLPVSNKLRLGVLRPTRRPRIHLTRHCYRSEP